jgi:SAM-dependent methyltransferase
LAALLISPGWSAGSFPDAALGQGQRLVAAAGETRSATQRKGDDMKLRRAIPWSRSTARRVRLSSSYTVASDENAPHLGGNLSEGDPQTYSPSVWDYTIDRFGIESVLDLGSGRGNASHYFFKRGLKVVAVDGMLANVEGAIFPTVLHDITHGPLRTRVDLVHCQEVVEHIEEQYLESLLDCLTNGKYILMTHALPGQGGHHHVNLQPPEYWIDHQHGGVATSWWTTPIESATWPMPMARSTSPRPACCSRTATGYSKATATRPPS